MIYIDCEQGEEEWLAHRRGIPTASETGRIITPKTGALAAGVTRYIAELIAETVVPDDSFTGNKWTERGHELEPEARDFYRLITGNKVTETGIVLLDDRSAGASPDGLVNDDGLLEIKCPAPKTHCFWMMPDPPELPDEHKVQCHAEMFVTERRWIDFLSYCPGFKHLLVRVEWDSYTDKVGAALAEFTQRLNAAKSRLLEEA